MYVSTILFDFIDLKGELNSIMVKAKENNDHIIIDRIEDVVQDKNFKGKDISGTRIYNLDDCKVNSVTSMIKSFENINNNKISFTFEHMGIPLSPNYRYTIGYYNFTLPPNFKFTKLKIVDPYSNGYSIDDKREFRYDLNFDSKLETQLVTMELRSRRDTFSFILSGEAEFLPESEVDESKIVRYKSIENALSENSDYYMSGKKFIKDFVNETNTIIELKPNFFGIGINFNALIDKIKNWH